LNLIARAPVPASAWRLRPVLAGGTLLACAIVVAGVGRHAGMDSAVADGVAQLGVGAMILTGVVEAYGVRAPRVAGFWRLLRWALSLIFGAYLFTALSDFAVPGPWQPVELASLLASYPFLFGALCRRAVNEEGFEGGMATLLDVAILVCSLMVATVPVLVLPLVHEHNSVALGSGITWGSDVGLLAGAVWVFYRLPRGADVRSVGLLAAALAVFCVLTLVEATLQIHGGGSTVPWWLTALYGPPYALVALAPRFERAEVGGVPSQPVLGHWLSGRVGLPYVAFVPLMALWFVGVARGWDTRLFGSGIATVAALVVVRQLILLRERHLLLVERAHQALTDELTRVRNRRAFDEDLAQLLDIAQRRAGSLVVLMVDLDDLKVINDSQGHLAGDRALIAVASALFASARTSDRVYRLGGDEFAMLLPDAARAGAERILSDARARMGQVDSGLSMSAGIAEYPQDADESEALLMKADRRLYQSKRVRPGARGGAGTDGAAGTQGEMLAAGEAIA
jgi:diguanylate cyclase (GGDEF)-like protein